ncbi:adaptor protein NBP2, partial [Cyberlindnera jadinii NRRL Y-1542]
AVALFDFTPENDNEIGLTMGQIVWINYRYGQGWLVAEDDQGEIGLVPEEYVQLLE